MSFFERLFRRNKVEFATLPSEITQVNVARVAVRMAEEILIVQVSPEVGPVLADASRSRSPVQLIAAQSRPVAFVPVTEATRPVLDPTRGWIIPVDETLATSLAELSATPGDYELAEWLVIAVEEN